MKSDNLKINIWIAICVVIVLACDVFFVSEKEGYHMDEILSYELSNSEFTPWITPTQPVGRLEKYYRNEIYDDNFIRLIRNLFGQVSDVLKNRSSSVAASYTADVYETPVWMTSEDMKEYVTFYDRDSVIGLSAYYNSTTDNHPPLYFMILNVFSAIYAIFCYGKLSVWPGCILNMICMTGSLIMVALIFRDIIGRKNLAPVAVLFYGLSPAGLNTVLLIRMYSMTAFFCLSFTYLLLKGVIDGHTFKKHNKKLILVTFMGFLTQYFVCIYYFFLVLAVVIHLLYVKKGKTVMYLLRTMAVSALIGVAVYPFVFHDLFGTKIGDSVMENLSSGLGGYIEKLVEFGRISLNEVLWSVPGSFAVLLMMLVSFIIAALIRKVRPYAPCLFFAVVGYYLTVSKIAPYTVDRYLMPVFPIMTICFGWCVAYVITFLGDRFVNEKDRGLIYNTVLIIWSVTCIVMAFVTELPYLYTGYSRQEKISERYSYLDAVVIYEGTSFYQNVPELMNYRSCLLLKEDEMETYDEKIASMDSVMLIVGPGLDGNDILVRFGSMYGFSSLTYIMEEGVFGDNVCLLSK